MSHLHAVIGTAALAVLALGFVSALLKNNSTVSEPFLALVIGFAVGPAALGLVDLSALGDPHAILRETARYTVGVAVMTAALRVPSLWLKRHAGAIVLFLTVGMAVMWLASAGVAALVLGLSLWPAMLLGAVCTPTDPVLAGSIVEGDVAKERVPKDPRHLLSAEAGANDGLALPFVAFALLMTQGERVWPDFAIQTVLREVLGAAALGLVLGVLAALAGRTAKRHGLEEAVSAAPTTLALALLAVGLGRAVGLDGILASFVAGVSFAALRSQSEDESQLSFDVGTKRLFELPVFVLLGLALPVTAWEGHGYPLLFFAAALILLRRPPAITLLARTTSAAGRWPEAAYVGWFGPIGIAALFYSLHVEHELGEAGYFEIVSFVIAASAVIHGFMAEPVARRFPRAEALPPGQRGR